ncbi:lipid II:glycine glycyltransferase (peptidoglycan interpeptide bridge formation enzyme) [Psychromicrobium silvestre]|uniref:Lipid II:glycine glycyltransferase (Peptidoglycan interpeptide bridge formation enzyme) n=1 Tax=Psychromicrobium silvestre TaxID=1645614 RepID=A0A7Y9LVE0_9MICC|nr:peptidoglycan bridge formation glycyltransferase FemA/FemB family protein [Psychromicrobium silvestre]NYE96325.1 lipid II:glycine glycyltransferase (peptidoglycan interpeptide bridge formation enzyme) [Psychromicrobium silvestre]
MPVFTARFASPEEREHWDAHVTANPQGGNLLQSEAFAEVKADYGWSTRFLVLECPEYSSYNLVLEKSIPLLGKLWYLIKGPDLAEVEHASAALSALRDFITASKLGVFAVRIEPDVVDSLEARRILQGAGLVKTPNLQPNDSTAILDTTAEPQQLLRNLSSRARNAIRRAQREGVEVEQVAASMENFRTMYQLMAGTIAEKGKTQLREFDYYQKFWQGFIDRGQGRHYFVYEDGKAAVGAFVINYGHKGTYKDGGSLIKRSRYGDSHLLQWVAINDLKQSSMPITEYDFCGTPPADKLKDTSHPHYGLGLFKTSFTKTVTDFVGCWDLVLSPMKYKAWDLAGERIARQLYTRRTGQQFY